MTDLVRLEVRLLHPHAKVPTKKRSTDVGYDIHSVEDVVLKPGATIVRTGIQVSAPPGYYYTIEGRSSLWIKGIFPNRGIIDSTYCGEVVVSLINVRNQTEPGNSSNDLYYIKAGDRIAQIILGKQYDADFRVVDEFSELYNQRGTDGFGSTGR